MYDVLYDISQNWLVVPFMAILIGSIIITLKTKFIQVRMIPRMIELFFRRQRAVDKEHYINPRAALFTAMATTIGIGNIVAPVVAIGFGGPGSLLGFVLATLFGSATSFVEVTFALFFRKRYSDGTVKGGPMEYLRVAFYPWVSLLYAFLTFILLIVWIGSQSNQLAVLISTFKVPRFFSGISVMLIVIFILLGGIKRVGKLAERLVPIMFLIYAAAMLWIIGSHISKLPQVIWLVITSACTPRGFGGASLGFGFQKAMRWGLAKGFFSNEAGIGTATIPHSASQASDPVNQGILSMVSVYTNGFLCILSGLVVLLTDAWLQPGLTFDITMVGYAFSRHFHVFGLIILALCGILFSFSTILGNSYNGIQCFRFVTRNRFISLHYLIVALALYVGAVSDANYIWSIADIFLIPVAIPHMIGIVVLLYKRPDIIKC